tara:strand:+ start:4201 stop:4638 length:438 start_codon:yes stop_codon:yes gene_type:complete
MANQMNEVSTIQSISMDWADYFIIPSFVFLYSLASNGISLAGLSWASLSLVAFVILQMSFEPIFVAVMFFSYYLAELVIHDRILTDATSSTKRYATIGLTFIFMIVVVMVITGMIEPYQSAILFVLFYIFQARFKRKKTNNVTNK